MTEYVVVKYGHACGPQGEAGGLKPVKMYYAGYYAESFADSGVIWYKTHRSRRSRFSEAVANMAAKQLRWMGHEVTVEPLLPRDRKMRRILKKVLDDAQRPKVA